MNPNEGFDDSELLRAFEARMTEELGWVASQQYPADLFEDKQNPMESFDRSPNVLPYETDPDQNAAATPLPRDGNVLDPFAAHDAGDCGCESLDQLRDSLKKMAARNRFELTFDQIEHHAEKIDASNRKKHLYSPEQTEAQGRDSITTSRRKQRGKCLSQSKFIQLRPIR
jgi:hypothetical protein